MNTSLVWLQIPAAHFEVTVLFYEELFRIRMERRILFDKRNAIFSIEQLGIKGSIEEVPGHVAGQGIKPVFYVPVMSEALNDVRTHGGRILRGPDLLRQRNSKGQVVIGTNLIDGQVGYYAEILDPDGNHLFLYSHS